MKLFRPFSLDSFLGEATTHLYGLLIGFQTIPFSVSCTHIHIFIKTHGLWCYGEFRSSGTSCCIVRFVVADTVREKDSTFIFRVKQSKYSLCVTLKIKALSSFKMLRNNEQHGVMSQRLEPSVITSITAL
jgi:hypothetical protein